MSFDIRFDYRFDTAGFFDNPDARAALEEAARLWESVIDDEFEDVPAGVDFFVSDPVDGSSERVVLDQPIDDLLIFVGASAEPFGIAASELEELPEGLSCGCSLCHAHHEGASETEAATVLARAGFSGFGAQGDALNARVTSNFRGQGPATDFEPYAGVAGFNTEINWSFDLESAVSGTIDFVTVAVHEIGHVLGIGTAGAWDLLSASGAFTGPNATAANGGSPVPLESDLAHVRAGHAGNSVVMDPSISSGQRVPISPIDLGLLADIGYEITGLTAQGALHEIVTEGPDQSVFGTVVADLIDGLGGADRIQGNSGDDTLIGGEGSDTLFGQAGADSLEGGSGADYLAGGTGDDLLAGGGGLDTLLGDGGTDQFAVAPGGGTDTIGDFNLATETLLVAAAFGFSSTAEVLATAEKPFSNVTRLQLDETTAVDIFHSSQSGTPLTEANIVLQPAEVPNSAPTAAPDTATVTAGEMVMIDALANDTDPDDDPLTITAFGAPGTGQLEVVDGQFRYTAPEGFSGIVQWDYGIGDGRGGGSGSFVTVTVEPPEPVAETWLGSSSADVRYGGAADDTLRGEGGNDTIGGGSGNDLIDGIADDDLLFGEAGNDVVQGGYGFDVLLGNDGDDRLIGDIGDGVTGQNDQLYGGSGLDTLEGEGGSDTLYGEAGNDSIIGGPGFDVVFGGPGADTVAAGSEADTVDGGSGDDTIRGGADNDLLAGAAGNDLIEGEGGPDFLDGGAGLDTLNGGSGFDVLLGGGDADTLSGGAGPDMGLGGSGDDELRGGTGSDSLFGEAGNDQLFGEAENDIVFGNEGNDTVFGGSGADAVIGEGGADSLVGGSGDDLVAGGSGNDTLLGGSGIDLLDGGGEDDRIEGGGQDDILFGRGGADSLFGDAGADFALGGAGADTIEGGTGADSLAGDGGADLFVFRAGDGDDLIFDFTLGLDTIRFEGMDVAASFAELVLGTDGGGRATVSYGTDPGDILRLQGVAQGDLSDDGTFLFA